MTKCGLSRGPGFTVCAQDFAGCAIRPDNCQRADRRRGLRSGLSNKEIANNLSLSEVTVKHHIKSLRGKLGARNRVRAVCRANELDIR